MKHIELSTKTIRVNRANAIVNDQKFQLHSADIASLAANCQCQRMTVGVNSVDDSQKYIWHCNKSKQKKNLFFPILMLILSSFVNIRQLRPNIYP